ncbi:MAG: polysaccharide deacetylase family protein [Longimicrobiales bacterium]
MNRILRLVLLRLGVLLYHAGLSRLFIVWHRRVPKVVLYHACEERESDFIRGLNSNITPTQFAQHLDFLLEHYQLIGLAALEEGRIPERALVVTFDDGYHSVYRHAFPLLTARKIPATVYLVTRTVNNRQLVWVNALNWLLHRHADVCIPLCQSMLGVPPQLHSPKQIVDHVQAHYATVPTEQALVAIYSALAMDPVEHARQAELYVTWPQVQEMSQSGITFGSHTARHPNLRRLKDHEQHSELQEALRAMQAVGGRPSLAYPFGEFNADSRQQAIALGHTTVMEVGGLNQPLDLHAIARVPVTARSSAELFAELEIVTPVMAWLKRRLRRD